MRPAGCTCTNLFVAGCTDLFVAGCTDLFVAGCTDLFVAGFTDLFVAGCTDLFVAGCTGTDLFVGGICRICLGLLRKLEIGIRSGGSTDNTCQ